MLMLFSNRWRHDKKWQIRFVACPAEASSQTTAPAAAKFGAGLIKNQLKPYPAKMLVRCECSEDPTMGPHKRALGSTDHNDKLFRCSPVQNMVPIEN